MLGSRTEDVEVMVSGVYGWDVGMEGVCFADFVDHQIGRINLKSSSELMTGPLS